MDYNFYSDTPESNIVFLGNVGYDTTEEQLRKTLELAGPVIEIRLLFDSTTNRSRGFGFCQFADVNVAASAIKNLNDTLVDNRNIKIGYADQERVRRYLGTDGTTLSNKRPAKAFGGNGGLDKVERLVDSLSEEQQKELLAQFRSFAQVNMGKARNELAKNPQLAYALLCATRELGLVDRSQLNRAEGHEEQRLPPQPQPQQPPLPAQNPSPSVDNTEVLKQLLSLTDDQLAQLPEDHRKQIMDLKKQLEAAT